MEVVDTGKPVDLTGKQFGRLKVIGLSKDVYIDPKHGVKYRKWDCLCSCGNLTSVRTSQLTCNGTKSCGCLLSDIDKERNYKHGKCERGSRDRLYSIWAKMKNRCLNPNDENYQYYGGKGINVCSEWADDYVTFEAWALSNGYDPNAERYKCTIDRIDSNKDYCPENCRWVDMTVQCNNRSVCRYITYNEETHTVSEWARLIGMDFHTLRDRLFRYGWSIDEAFNTPVDKTNWIHKEEHLNNGIHA